MEKLTSWFERTAVAALIVLLMVTILCGTVIVAWSLVVDLRGVHELVAEPKALFDVFGLYVALLVGIELLKILRHFRVAHEVDAALVVQTALIALCNKIITMNVLESSWTTLLALATLTIALAGATFALRRGSGSLDPQPIRHAEVGLAPYAPKPL
jgi:uncharacterized membrane protein (DUF373 family)